LYIRYSAKPVFSAAIVSKRRFSFEIIHSTPTVDQKKL